MSNINVLGKKLNNVDVMKFEKQEGGHAYYLEGEYVPVVYADLPEELRSATTYYKVKINEDKWLLSTNITTYPLWLYDNTTKNWSLIYDRIKTNFSVFKQVSNTKWLIIASSLTLLYNSSNDSIIELSTTRSSWASFDEILDGRWLIRTGSSGGVNYAAVYDVIDDSFIKLGDSSKSQLDRIVKLDDSKWLLGSNSNYTYGVVLYNNSDMTVQIVPNSTTYRQLNQFEIVGSKCLIINGYSSSVPILAYDIENNSISTLNMFTTFAPFIIKVTDDKYLISILSNDHLYSFNPNTNELTELSQELGRHINSALKISDTRWILHSYYIPANNSTIRVGAILDYNPLTDELVGLGGTACFTDIEKINDNEYLLLGAGISSYSGVFVYNIAENSILKLSTNNLSGANIYKNIGGAVMLCAKGGLATSGIGIYVSPGFYKSISVPGISLFGFRPIPAEDGTDNYILVGSNTNIVTNKLYYNITNNTVAKLTYKLQ